MIQNQILRTSDSLDMLEGDFSQIDTSYPLLPESLQDFEIVDVSVVQNKTQTGDNLVIKMKTRAENRAAKTGDVIPAGFPCTTRMSLTETENYPRSSIEKGIATFVQAAGVKTIKPLEQWPGKLVQAKVSITPEKGTFPASNAFRFVPLKKTA